MCSLQKRKNKDSTKGNEFIICLSLVLVVLVVYWQVANHDFIHLDDIQYVIENPHVQAGFTRHSVVWAFTATHAANWHPLTWLSHMLDCQLYDLNPMGHHLTNLLFHLANTLLLFIVLKQMTGAIWRSGLVAALFALHPLHVESVAWVAERKDVLSTFFWLFTMWTYGRYVAAPGSRRYLLTLFVFALGLMAKPMLVTLPFVLLLLDYWPLGRFRVSPAGGNDQGQVQVPLSSVKTRAPSSRLIWEKIPFFIVSLASCVVTFLVQQKGGAVETVEAFPLTIRIGNALVSYVSYMGKMIWPRSLAVFYPHPGTSLPWWQAIAAGLLLIFITIGVIRAGRQHAYLAVGWLWYLGTLVPVIGLVQVGAQALADRYTYVPLIGLFIMISWFIPDLLTGWRHRGIALSGAAVTVVSALMVCTWMQLQHWKNDITLFEHALKVTANNYLAHDSLGNALAEQGKLDQAITHYSAALRIKPNSLNTHNTLGVAFLEGGDIDQAITHYYAALRLKSDSAETHNNLGVAFFSLGQLDKAIGHYLTAIKLDPTFSKAHNNLGNALVQKGKLDEAISQYHRALEIKTNYPEAHNNLGVALARQGKMDEAVAQFEKALWLKPDYAQARKNLELALQMVDETTEATITGAHP
jgi:Flp pilus assembly protein TadD